MVCCSTLLWARSARSSTPRGREETTAKGIAAGLVSLCGTNGGGFGGQKREERGGGRREAEELQWKPMVQVVGALRSEEGKAASVHLLV